MVVRPFGRGTPQPPLETGDFLSPAQVVQAEAAEAKATAEANLAGSTKVRGGQLWNLKGTSPSSPRKRWPWDGGGGKGPLDSL